MNIIRHVLLIAAFLVLYASCVSGQEMESFYSSRLPDLDEKSTLDDYIRYALLNNPGLKASFERWKASLESVEPASALPDPRFTYSNYIEEVETRVGAQKQSIGIAQTFPWFGKLDLRGKIALQAANAEQQRYEASKLDLIYRIKKIYYEYCYLAQAINITKDNMTLVTYFESVARAKYKGGTGLQNAVIKTQVELGKLEDRLASLEDSIRPVAAKLNMTMNRSSNLPLHLPASIPEVKYDLIDEEVISLMRENNPGLKALDFMAAKENLTIELAGKNYFPDFTLGVNYIDTDSRLDANPPDNGKDPIIASLSINIPIWRKKYDSQSREAENRHSAVLLDRAEKENSLIADLEMALYEQRDADRKIALYRDTLLPKAEQNVNINQQAFASDKATFLDLIDSQRVLLEFQIGHKRALADYAQAVAEIEMMIGGNFKKGTR